MRSTISAVGPIWETIDRPIGEVAATMLHEMAHLYNLTHGIEDVSNNGYYHNKKFKETAEAHGLHIEKHDKYGWTITTLNAETVARIAQQPELLNYFAEAISLYLHPTTVSEGGKTSFDGFLKYHKKKLTAPDPLRSGAVSPESSGG